MLFKFGSLLLLALIFFSFTPTESNAAQQRYERSVHQYTVPDVVLVNQDRKKVRLKSLIESDKPVIVDFIYGTCTTICPVLSAGFANLQRKLGPDVDKVQLISVTIDPENDTPEVLKKYLERYNGKPGWDILTGSRRDINSVMNGFDSFFRDKMDHKPLTFIRSPQDGSWIRLYGLISGRDFLKECSQLGI